MRIFDLSLNDVTLIAQIVAFIILSYGVASARKSIVKHRKMTRYAFSLTGVFIVFMVYSFIVNSYLHLPQDLLILLLLHMSLGAAAVFFGILFVSNQVKWKIRKNMRATFILWSGSLILGALFYLKIFGYIS